MSQVMIHPLAGVLSAYGMGLADTIELRQRSLGGAALEPVLDELEAQASAALRAQGIEQVETLRRAALRYKGSDSSLEVEADAPEEMREEFEALHKSRFGFLSPGTAVVIETAIVEAIGKAQDSAPAKAGAQAYAAAVLSLSPGDDPFIRSDLAPGTIIPGPALIIDPSATTIVEPGWQAEVDPHENLILTRTAPRTSARAIGTAATR
jgi:5-oxoprolinase (ATP-hydrolysing)